MTWGVIGGVAGFLASLLGPPVGLVVGGIVGYLCGKRAAAADPDRQGALSGLISGSIAMPVFVVGSCAGALVNARMAGFSSLTASLRNVAGMEISSEQAWRLYLVTILLTAVFQAATFVGAATAAGALAKRK